MKKISYQIKRVKTSQTVFENSYSDRLPTWLVKWMDRRSNTISPPMPIVEGEKACCEFFPQLPIVGLVLKSSPSSFTIKVESSEIKRLSGLQRVCHLFVWHDKKFGIDRASELFCCHSQQNLSIWEDVPKMMH